MDPIPPSAGAALGFVLLVGSALCRASSGRSASAAALASASAVAAVLLATWLSGIRPSFPPVAFRDWAALALLSSVPLAWIASRGRWQACGAIAVLAALLAALFAIPTETLHERYWDGRVAEHVGGMSLVGLVAVLVRWGQSARGRVPEGMLAFALAALAAAPTLGLTGTGVSAALAGALAGAAGTFGLATVAIAPLRSSLGPVGVAAGTTQIVALMGALATGALYAETPLWSAAVLVLAPAATLLPGAGLRGAVIRLALVVGCCAVPAVAASIDQPAPNPYG